MFLDLKRASEEKRRILTQKQKQNLLKFASTELQNLDESKEIDKEYEGLVKFWDDVFRDLVGLNSKNPKLVQANSKLANFLTTFVTNNGGFLSFIVPLPRQHSMKRQHKIKVFVGDLYQVIEISLNIRDLLMKNINGKNMFESNMRYISQNFLQNVEMILDHLAKKMKMSDISMGVLQVLNARNRNPLDKVCWAFLALGSTKGYFFIRMKSHQLYMRNLKPRSATTLF